MSLAAIAQLGERQTEDLEVSGSIPGLGNQHMPVVITAVVGICALYSICSTLCAHSSCPIALLGAKLIVQFATVVVMFYMFNLFPF